MKTLKDELSSVELGVPTRFRNLTVYPVLRPAPERTEPDYLLLEEAIELGVAHVTEVSDGGSVPELRFENMSDRPVLLLDGEELLGAKQNRVLNLTILVGPKQSLAIPVSCVEAGRWQMREREFRTAPHVMYSRARAQRAAKVTESMRQSGSRRSDQGAVWDEIALMAERMEASSPTGAMNAIYEKHAVSIEHYLRAFKWQERQAGVVFWIGGHTCGLDLLDHPGAMRRLFPKLIRSYALDALDQDREEEVASIGDAAEFINKVATAPSFSEPAIGLGKDLRLVAQQLSGAALYAGQRYVHVCAFTTNGHASGPRFQTRMSRPSGRRG